MVLSISRLTGSIVPSWDCRLHGQRIFAEVMIHRKAYSQSCGVVFPKLLQSTVNGQWGPQEDPFAGDVINSYNDGPVEDGSIMGPFYEIETSSPGAELAPGASLVHTQKVIHIQGKDEQLVPIVQDLFGADLNVIKTKFQ